jgi:hypothetical protein
MCGCVGVCGCVCVGVYTKSKTSELSPLRRKLLRFAKQFPPPLRSNEYFRNYQDCLTLSSPRNIIIKVTQPFLFLAIASFVQLSTYCVAITFTCEQMTCPDQVDVHKQFHVTVLKVQTVTPTINPEPY